jgi:hypothetical protein
LTRLARVLALLSIITVLACARRAEPDFEQRGPPPPETGFSASGPLRYEGRVVPTGNRTRPLRAALIARNPGPDTVSLSYGECSFGLYAYREPIVGVAPVWDNRSQVSECLLIGYEAVIPPGGSETFAVEPSRSSRGYANRLAPGRYFFGIGFRDRDGQFTIVPAGEVRVP